jgi:hypothetical protein
LQRGEGALLAAGSGAGGRRSISEAVRLVVGWGGLSLPLAVCEVQSAV